MYWERLSKDRYIWKDDGKFILTIVKLGDTTKSWVVRVVWNWKLIVNVICGLSYSEALKEISRVSLRENNPAETIKHNTPEATLVSSGFTECQVPTTKLLKIASDIRGEKISTLVGGRWAPQVYDDGRIVFSMYISGGNKSMFDRIAGVISSNGFELIDYTLFSNESPAVYLKLQIKKRNK